MALVSVVLPVFNQERYIAETIQSVLNQTFKDFELLILDDGSTDNSAKIIESFSKIDNRIRATYWPNAGRCKATNSLVSMAKGRWCAFLDADDVMLPQRIERQLAFHQHNSEIDASSCHCYYINSSGATMGEQRHPYLKTVEECRAAFVGSGFVQCAITGLFISRQTFIDAGGLNAKYWPCDDFEFVNRLIEKRYIVVVLQETLMKYRIHAAAITIKKPLHTYNVIGYVMENIRLRRAGKPENSFEDFMAARAAERWWIRLNRRRFNYSQIFFRNAGISVMSKNFGTFCWQIFIASILSPYYVLNKALSLSKR